MRSNARGTDRTIARGTGLDPSTREAYVFAWDPARRRVAWKRVP